MFAVAAKKIVVAERDVRHQVAGVLPGWGVSLAVSCFVALLLSWHSSQKSSE